MIYTRPFREAIRHLASAAGVATLTRHETGWACVDAVCLDLDCQVADRLALLVKKAQIQGIYAYEDGSLASFRRAKELGIRRFYDLPTAYWKFVRAVLEEEAELQPEWACTLTGILDSAEKLFRKDEELQLADIVFVASSFTRESLALANLPDGKPVIVIPYGAPPCQPAFTPISNRSRNHLRVLFVGGLKQQKGLSYLLAAVKMLGSQVELTMIGRVPSETCAPLNVALARHRHIHSLPHEEILAEMRRHDVFVFPSLCDGFGLVLLEAMSQGLPVIATPNCGAPDLVAEGENGFIVPIRSSRAIAERLEVLHNNRDRLHCMGESAMAKAQEQTWSRYQSALMSALSQDLSQPTRRGAGRH